MHLPAAGPALGAALLIGSAAFAANTPVEKVDVAFNLKAVESATAAQFWGDLETDLEGAIIAKIADRTAENGTEVEIDIDEFSMSSDFQAAMGGDSILTGDVTMVNEEDPTVNHYFTVKVMIDRAGKVVYGDDGVEVRTVDEGKVYEAMVDAFATKVVNRLD